MKGILRAAAVAVPLIVLPGSSTAYAAPGDDLVEITIVDTGSPTQGVTGQCSYRLLPNTDNNIDVIHLAYTTSAHARGSAMSTSVICTLRPSTSPNAYYDTVGITLPGSDAATGETAEIPRDAPAIFACVTVAAAFLDGTTEASSEECQPWTTS